MSSSPEASPGGRQVCPAWLPRGLAILILLPVFAFRLVWAFLPAEAGTDPDRIPFSRVILDGRGKELQVLPLDDGLRRIWVSAGEFSPVVEEAVLAAEDRRFWLHPGVDPASLARALFQNASSNRTVSGASTLGMQLHRLLVPRKGRDTATKLAEMAGALGLESRLGKSKVLELYLNMVPFGRNIEGFPAAARIFFGKSVTSLDRGEALVLSVIPRSPSRYDPWSSRDDNRRAARLVAQSAGIDPAEVDRALDHLCDPDRPGIWPYRAPHFVGWLRNTPEFLAGDSRMPWPTSLEPDLQSWLEDQLARTVAEAEYKRVSNAAALFLRPDTMEVAAWVGSVDFRDGDAGQVDGVLIRRQPGSTLKPFLYALALEKGLTAATVLPDIPQDFGTREVYLPANFNDQTNGPVRLRQALASSLNLPAVYVLERLGVIPFTDWLIRMGLVSLEEQRGTLGLGLALGNAETGLSELVPAYGVFLHHGILHPLTARGASDTGSGTQVMDPAVADLVRDILTRQPDRTLAFGRQGNTRMKFPGAIKTGTSNQFQNIWAFGFTPDLLGGVWMGNFNGNTVSGTADSGYPARILTRTLEAFGSGRNFPDPRGLVKARICSLSGMLAGPACPHVMEEWFLPGTLPVSCDWHTRGPGGTVTTYPQEYRSWLDRYRYRSATASGAPLHILRPRDGAVFFAGGGPGQTADLVLEATGTGTAVLRVDGHEEGSFEFPLHLWLPLEKGTHTLELETTGPGAGSTVQTTYSVR